MQQKYKKLSLEWLSLHSRSILQARSHVENKINFNKFEIKDMLRTVAPIIDETRNQNSNKNRKFINT